MGGKAKSCKNCLWCWPDLLGGNGRKCYQNGGRRYRRLVTAMDTCPLYERRASVSDWAPYRATDEKTQKGGENHGGNTD